MSITHNPSSGVPLYHYTNKTIKENRDAAIRSNDKPLNRHQRRKLERKINKRISNNIKFED